MMLIAMAGVLSSFGETLLSWLPSINLWCAAVLLVVCILDRVLAPRVSSNIRLVLYLAVLVRVLLPLDFASPIGLLDVLVGDGSMSWWFTERSHAGMLAEDGSITAMAAGSPGTAAVFSPAGVAAALTYGLVAAALLIVWATLRRRLQNALRSARVLHVQGRRVLIHETIGPAVVGIIRPQIVIPHRLREAHRRGEITREDIRWVLAHETAHIARRDPLLLALAQLCVIVLWPVIPLWIALPRVRRLLEEACDARVLRASTDRRSYAETLLTIAQWMNTRRQPMTMNQIGLLGHCSFRLRARLRALGYLPGRRWPRVVQASICIIAAGSLIACAAQRGAPPEAGSDSLSIHNNDTPQILLTFTLIESPRMDDAAEIDPDDPRVLTYEGFATFLSGLTDDGARVLTAPRLLVLDEHEASVSIGDSEKGEEFFRFEVTPQIMRYTPSDDPAVLVDLTFDHSVGVDPGSSSSPRRHQRHESSISLGAERIAVFLLRDDSEPTEEPVLYLAVEAKILEPDAEISSR